MFREIKSTDKEIFFDFVSKFYDSEAVLHKIPIENIENTFEELMNGSQYTDCFIFEMDDKAVGYGLISKTYSNEAGGLCIWIEEVYIKEEYRSKGIGREFFNFVENKYKASRYRLEIERNNNRAYNLYKNKGYDILGYNQMYKDSSK